MTQREHVNIMEREILDALGVQGAFDALTKALGLDTLEEMYEYIIQVYDIEVDLA